MKVERKNIPGPMMSTMGYLKQEFWLNPYATLRSTWLHVVIPSVGDEPMLPCAWAFVVLGHRLYFYYVTDPPINKMYQWMKKRGQVMHLLLRNVMKYGSLLKYDWDSSCPGKE